MNETTNRRLEGELVEQARRVLPGGSFGNIPGEVVIREGNGGRVWDESGKEYVDFLLGSGPMLVGHAHPEVTAAAQAQMSQGTTFFANNRHGDRTGRGHCRCRALRRTGALRLLRVGGRPLRDARRPRLQEA